MTRGAAVSVPDEKTIAEAYVYLLGRILVIRQEHILEVRRITGRYDTVQFLDEWGR